MTTATRRPTPTIEERLAHVEATIEHLATKADIAELRAEIAELKGTVRVMLLGLAFFNALVSAILRFWPG